MQQRPSQILLVEDNPGDARLVREMLSDANSDPFEIHCVDSLVAALSALAQSRFDVALVDLSLPDSQGLQTLSAIQLHAADLPIVLLTGLDSESMALSAVKQGAQDYLVKGTMSPEKLSRALRYAIVRGDRSAESGKSAPARAAIVGILGAKGGVGATTIACHHALELQRQTGKAVLLIDLDVAGASAAFLMKARSEYTTLDATTNLYRLDADYFRGLVFTTGSGVDLLQPPGALRLGDELNGERVRHILRFARALYGWIVVDLGCLNALSLSLLEEIRELFLVSTRELPSLFDAARVLRKLLELGLTRHQVHLLLNRAAKRLSSSAADIEKGLGYPVFATLTDHSDQLDEHYAEGRFLDSDSHLHKQVAQYVAKSLGAEEQPAVRGGLGLFRFART